MYISQSWIVNHFHHVFMSCFKTLLTDIHAKVTIIPVTGPCFLIDRVLNSCANFIPAGRAMFRVDASSGCRPSRRDSFIAIWEPLKSLYLFLKAYIYIDEKIMKFMLHNHAIFIRHIHEINAHNKTCFFISHMSILILWKIMISSIAILCIKIWSFKNK